MRLGSRRGFLRFTLGACWTSASLLEQSVLRAAQARAQAASKAGAALFDIEKVAEGVWAAIARPAALINCNACIFEQANDILIVDTHSKPSAVVSLVQQIRRDLTRKPVRYIVNSHFHWDHTQGAPTYRRIAPQADIVSSEATRKLLAENGAARLKASVEQAAKAIDDAKQKAADAKSPEVKAYYEAWARDAGEYVAEMRNYAPELPNVTLERGLIIHDKAHDLHLAFRGRGHTAGDVVVSCPSKKVVATGDLLHGFFPYCPDGYPGEWPRTLTGVAEFEFDRIVGGHGGVLGRERLYQMAGYIEELTDQVVRGKRAGKSVDELQRAIQPARLKSLDRDGYGSFLSGSLMKYAMHPPDATPGALIESGVQANIADIYGRIDT